MKPAECAWIFERAMERGEYFFKTENFESDRRDVYRWLAKYEKLTGDYKFRQFMVKRHAEGIRIVHKNLAEFKKSLAASAG